MTPEELKLTKPALIRDLIIDRMLTFFSVVCVFALASAQYRAMEIGWLWRDWLQFLTVLALLWVTAKRRLLSTNHKALFLIAFCVLIGVTGFMTLGMLAGGIFCLPLAAVILSLFYSGWVVALFLGAMTLFLLATAAGFTGDYLTLTTDVEVLFQSPRQWLVFIICVLLFSIVCCASLLRYRKITTNLMQEIARQRDELATLAYKDELTGLPTRRLALDRLAMACHRVSRSQQKLVLMFVDLDDFKRINDDFGHKAGDHCLMVIAERLQRLLRDHDTVARLGGDEFLVILEEINSERAAVKVGNKIIDKLCQPIRYREWEFQVGASIGMALCPDHSVAPKTLLRLADEAMYCSKRQGKGQVRVAAANS